MSTNHTPNLNLSQWVRSDQVLMDDFNADNAKIDAALACHPSAELICSAEVTDGETSQVKLDLSQVDWPRYLALALRIEIEYSAHLRVSVQASRERSVFLRQDTASTSGGSDSLLILNYVSHCSMFLPVFYNGENLPSAIAFGSGYTPQALSGHAHFSAGGGMTPLKDSSHLIISRTENYFSSGDRFALWGIK